MSNRSRRVKVKPKMYILEGKIGGQNRVMTATRAHDGRIVPDAEVQTPGAFGPAAA